MALSAGSATELLETQTATSKASTYAKGKCIGSEHNQSFTNSAGSEEEARKRNLDASCYMFSNIRTLTLPYPLQRQDIKAQPTLGTITIINSFFILLPVTHAK